LKREKSDKRGSNCTNFLEVRAYGLMRSGNHAIIEWIQNQYPGQITCFLNNIKHGDHDPYTNYSQRVLTGIDGPIDTEVLRTMKKRLLIYSYEDRQELEFNQNNILKSIFQPDFEKNRQYYLGTSRHQFDMLIIRDPFNFFASRLKLLQVRGPQGGVSDPGLILQNWKTLAREALILAQDPQPGKIVANFNRWVADHNYRKDLSQRLMGSFNDSSIDKIPQFGGGSSFRDSDKLTMSMILANWKKLLNVRRYTRFGHYWKRFTAPNNENKLFERWKHFAEDENFLKLVLDNELIELSKELFGEIPGTPELLSVRKPS